MNFSIKTKLALTLLTLAALFMAGGGWLVYRQIWTSFHKAFDERLRLQALSLTTGIKQEREYVDVIFSDRYLREYDDDSPSWFFQIWAPLPLDDPEKPETMRSESLRKNENLPKRFGTMESPVCWDFELSDGRPCRGIGLRYVPHADGHDRKRNFDPDLHVELVVAQDRSELEDSLSAVARSIGITCGTGLAATMLVVPFVLTRLLRPLRLVSRQAEAIDADTLSNRFETGVPPEIRPICQALNGLLARLESSFERERQLSSDIAHELRTPISELKSYAELKIKWPDKTEGCFEKEVLQMVVGMESLVANLLTVARMEKQAEASERVVVALGDAVNEVVKAYRNAASERGIRINHESESAPNVETQPDLLQIILRNLISNAVAHSPRDSEVTISYGRGDDLVSISNPAPDLDREDLPRMFDRLWRKDASRSDHAHTGLGLPLAQCCAKTIGLEITAAIDDERLLEIGLVRV